MFIHSLCYDDEDNLDAIWCLIVAVFISLGHMLIEPRAMDTWFVARSAHLSFLIHGGMTCILDPVVERLAVGVFRKV